LIGRAGHSELHSAEPGDLANPAAAGRQRPENAYYALGAIYYNLARPADSVRTMRKAAEAAPADANIAAYLGRAHVLAGEFAEAEAALKRALGLDPASRLALLGLGELQYARGGWAEAIRYFEESKTTQVPALLKLCQAYFKEGKRRNAFDTAELVRIFGSDDPQSLKALDSVLAREQQR
jgi:tetratricopeptide (TPR) repeat protein